MAPRIDRLIRSRRKTIALIVQRDGSLTVRAPLRLAEGRIHAFVESHAGWIIQNQAKIRAAAPPPSKRFTQGELFPYLGESFPLAIVPRQRPHLIFDGGTFKLAESARRVAEQAFIRWYKARALEVIPARVKVYAERYGFEYQKIRISSARTRWGSCSSKGSLSFTWRLLLTPPEVMDYVILHELVHLRVKNHSKAFWSSVAEINPEYKKYVRWLRQNGRLLPFQ